MGVFAKEIAMVERLCSPALTGRVSDVTGLTVTVSGLPAPTGTLCTIRTKADMPIEAQVVGFRDDRTLLMPLRDTLGVARGDEVVAEAGEARVGVCEALLGRTLDGMGQPIDGGRALQYEDWYSLYRAAPRALERARIDTPIATGIRAIDTLTTIGRGQRMGLFAGTGVGKSVLMGMIARNTKADVNVIGLIGERGREVREFLEKNLGAEGLARSVVVVAASDMHPLIRMRAAYVATAISEYFRDQGKDVLLMVDSLTRFAMAQREIGLSVGEPPTTKGYTPSVFSLLPKLLERSGIVEGVGSITGLYTILVEGDDFNEPISDAARSILDGHISLSRALANKNHYPAVDVLQSISRVMIDIVDAEHKSKAGELANILATYKKAEDIINIGAYVNGSNPAIDRAVRMVDRVNAFLQQKIDEKIDFKQAKEQLLGLFQE